jgi:hypothetical protein
MKVTLESREDATNRRRIELERATHRRRMSSLQTYFILTCAVILAIGYLVYLMKR